MVRLKLKLRSHLWLHNPADRPRETENEIAEVTAKSNKELLTVDKLCVSPSNNRSFDIAYSSKNGEQVKSYATRKAEVVSDSGCSCRRSSSNSRRVQVNKSRAWKKENTKGKGIVDHGNNNPVPSSGSSLVNSQLSSAAANSPASFHQKKLISNGKKSSSSATGFKPGTCTALDNKNHSIDSAACSLGDDENENEIEIDVVFCDLLAKKCEECACSDDVEGNSLILHGRSCSVHGKAGQSSAVLKKSKDPYSDFKCSMVHMIVEKNIYEPSELRGLLECFLCLNSPEHHGIIMEAFTEICVNISSVLSEGIRWVDCHFQAQQ